MWMSCGFAVDGENELALDLQGARIVDGNEHRRKGATKWERRRKRGCTGGGLV